MAGGAPLAAGLRRGRYRGLDRGPDQRRSSPIRAMALVAIAALGGCSGSGGYIPEVLPVPDGVVVDVREETFAIFGRSPGEIYQSLNQRGPASGGRIVWGLHSWRFDWDTRWARTETSCRVADLDLRMSTEITMPRWTQRAGAPLELQEMWEEFELLLREHEEAHREFAIEAVRDLHRAILSVEAPDCETASRRIRAQTDVIMERYNALNRDYDQRELLTWPPRR